MDQVRGPDFGFRQTLLPQSPANFMWRTLERSPKLGEAKDAFQELFAFAIIQPLGLSVAEKALPPSESAPFWRVPPGGIELGNPGPESGICHRLALR
jgi:hypothetical protein